MARGLITGERAKTYDERKKTGKFTPIFDKFIVDNIKKRGAVCDLGTGTGGTIEDILTKCNEIVGIEPSRDMIEIAKHKFAGKKKIALVKAKAHKTRQPDDYFDYVIMRMCFHHIKEKKEVMREVYRIIKPNGKILVMDYGYRDLLSFYFHELLNILQGNFKFFGHYITSVKNNMKIFRKYFRIEEKTVVELGRNSREVFMIVLEPKF